MFQLEELLFVLVFFSQIVGGVTFTLYLHVLIWQTPLSKTSSLCK